MGTDDTVDIDYVDIKAETDKAYLFTLEDGREIWAPKSQVDLLETRDAVRMPMWLAREKELV